MRHLSLSEVLELHRRIVEESRGSTGVRDLAALESAVAQPRMTFGGHDLYPEIPDKAAALGFSLVRNHPFVDGNKRVGHAAVEAFLMLNGFELVSSVDEAERTVLGLAAGDVGRETWTAWVRGHCRPLAK